MHRGPLIIKCLFRNNMKRATFSPPLKKDCSAPWSLTWNPGLAELAHTKPNTNMEVLVNPSIQSLSHSSSSSTSITVSNLSFNHQPPLGQAVTNYQVQPPMVSTAAADDNAAKLFIQKNSREYKMPVTVADNVIQNQDSASPNQSKPPNHSQKESSRRKISLKPPEKPVSNFTMFVNEHIAAFRKEGISYEEASQKAVKMWGVTSPVVKNRYQRKYEKLKAKYEIDNAKYLEKVKNKDNQKAKVKGSKKSKKSSASYNLPVNHYIQVKVSAPDLNPTDNMTVSNSSGQTHFMSSVQGSLTRSDNAVSCVPSCCSPNLMVSILPGQHSTSPSTVTVVPSSSSQVNPKDSMSSVISSLITTTTNPSIHLSVPLDKGDVNTNTHEAAVKMITSNTCVDVSNTDQIVLTDDNNGGTITDDNQNDTEDGAGETDIIAVEPNVNKENNTAVIETETDSRNRNICNLCKKVFMNLGWLQKHMVKCQEEFQCDSCPSRLKNLKCLKAHKKKYHGSDSGFRCDNCDALFSTENKLTVHIRKKHDVEQICPHCDSKSKNKAALRLHMLRHCKGLVHDRSRQTKKTAATESQEKPIKTLFHCKECGKVYNGRSGLLKHMKLHKKITKQSEMKGDIINKTDETENVVEDVIVENYGPVENLFFICDQNQSLVNSLQGQPQDIELVILEES